MLAVLTLTNAESCARESRNHAPVPVIYFCGRVRSDSLLRVCDSALTRKSLQSGNTGTRARAQRQTVTQAHARRGSLDTNTEAPKRTQSYHVSDRRHTATMSLTGDGRDRWRLRARKAKAENVQNVQAFAVSLQCQNRRPRG